ncbi:spore germination protein (amino acid permease) [Paenibacillus algorifonticola]|uniref:Spore germination protein (Amino acid permease) n=1 Tax=Paenibacillus algorifonticola TaxID=684063 RepID=A0A1I2A590_9BACL|nr:endospore germination permease [Paenibacillus algorifonticola]SFE39112.1 spore germination protein (amino acid permease) [Paenibacillus algorifonticola]
MNSYVGKQITLFQFISIISGSQVSVAVLNLPRKLSEAADTDGWIALIIGWALSLIAGLAIVGVMKYYPNGTLFDLLSEYMGRWAGVLAAMLFALYFFYLMYDGLVRTILVTKTWLLPTTQSFVLMSLLLIPAYSIVRHGIRNVARYAELIIWISLWIPFVYIYTLKHAHWVYLLPLLKEGWLPILTAVKATIYPMLGMVSIFILYPHLKYKEYATKGIVIANSITMLLYLFVTIICYVYFSPEESHLFNDPVISVLKSIEFKFIERIEVPFISFYLFIFSLIWIPMMYLLTYCIAWIFKRESIGIPLRLLIILLAVGTFFYFPTYNINNFLVRQLFWVGLILEYIFPVCLLCYLWLSKFWKEERSSL